MYKFIRVFLTFLLVSLIITQQASAMTIDEGKVASKNILKTPTLAILLLSTCMTKIPL
jgi:hypothetical protein